MADIFISYRRKDAEGHAGRLFDSLEETFGEALFFDREKIKPGSVFRDDLRREATACRVMLVVIAPTWADEFAERARKPDETDWVLEEISIALGRAQTEVIPVLVGEAELPARTALPDRLHGLLDRDAYTLSGKNWKVDLGKLIELLKTSVSTAQRRPAATVVTAQGAPIELAYLCDRTPQEDALAEALCAPVVGAPYYLLLIHGHRWDAHSGFIERLKFTRCIEKWLPGEWSRLGLDHHNIDFNWNTAKSGKYQDALCMALAKKVLPRPTNDLGAVSSQLRSARRPLLFTLSITGEEFAAVGSALLDGLAAAWRALAEHAAQAADTKTLPGAPAMLCCYVKYKDADDQNQTVVEKFDLSRSQLAGSVLPRLTPVNESDAEAWAEHERVQPFVGPARTRVMKLFKDPQYAENDCVRMQRFAEAVHEILNRAN